MCCLGCWRFKLWFETLQGWSGFLFFSLAFRKVAVEEEREERSIIFDVFVYIDLFNEWDKWSVGIVGEDTRIWFQSTVEHSTSIALDWKEDWTICKGLLELSWIRVYLDESLSTLPSNTIMITSEDSLGHT